MRPLLKLPENQRCEDTEARNTVPPKEFHGNLQDGMRRSFTWKFRPAEEIQIVHASKPVGSKLFKTRIIAGAQT